jgi:uncharacterized membrane protein
VQAAARNGRQIAPGQQLAHGSDEPVAPLPQHPPDAGQMPAPARRGQYVQRHLLQHRRDRYAEGGALAREYGGWRVICWTVILALPVTVPVTLAAAVADPPRHVTAGAVAGLAYVSFVSMCLGFFAWYSGLARGGVARVGRLQLAQPALTLLWSALLLGERVSLLTGAAAAAVIAATAVGRNARVDDPAASAAHDSATRECTNRPLIRAVRE